MSNRIKLGKKKKTIKSNRTTAVSVRKEIEKTVKELVKMIDENVNLIAKHLFSVSETVKSMSKIVIDNKVKADPELVKEIGEQTKTAISIRTKLMDMKKQVEERSKEVMDETYLFEMLELCDEMNDMAPGIVELIQQPTEGEDN